MKFIVKLIQPKSRRDLMLSPRAMKILKEMIKEIKAKRKKNGN